MKILALVHPPARMGDSSLLLKREREIHTFREQRVIKWIPGEGLWDGDFSLNSVEKREAGVWVGMEGGARSRGGACSLPVSQAGTPTFHIHPRTPMEGGSWEKQTASWFRTDRSTVTPATSLQELRGDPEDSSALERERVCLRSGDCTPGPRRSAALGWETW